MRRPPSSKFPFWTTRAHLSPVRYIRDPPLSGEHIREVSRLSWKWRKRSPVKIIGRTIGQTAQALVYVPGAVPSVTGTGNLAPLGEAANTARLHLEAAGTSLPNAQASVAVNSLGLLDLVQIAAKGLSPKAQYQVYLAESEAEPFGRAGASGSSEDKSGWRRHCSINRSAKNFSWYRCRWRFTQIPNRYQIRRPVAGRASAS